MLSIRHGVKRTRCSLFANTIPSTVDFSNRVACRWHSNSIPTSTTTSSSSSSEAVGESSTNDDVVSISRLISMHQQTVTAESLPRVTSLKEPSSSFAASSSSSLHHAGGMGSNNMKPTTPGDSVSDPVDSATVGPDSTHSPVASREQSLESMLDDINPILAAQRLRRRILQPWFDIKAKIEKYHQRFQQALPKIKLALTMTAIALVGVATWMSVRTIIQTFEDFQKSAISMHNRVEEFVTNMEYRWEHREKRLQELQESIIATNKVDVVHSVHDTIDTLSKAEENIQKAKESIEEKRQALITSLDVRMNEVKEEVETKLDRIRNRGKGNEENSPKKELKFDFDRFTELRETISNNADKLRDKVSSTWFKASEREESKLEQAVKDKNSDDSKSNRQ